MNKKSKTILLIAGFSLFIAIAVFAYNWLSKEISPQNNMDISQNEGKTPPADGNEENNSQTTENQEESQTAENQEPEKVEAPDFTVLDADGNPVKLSDLFGKPIVLNFWASWCGPCKTEMPEFNEEYLEVGEDITFMMVDLVDGVRETIKTGEKYVAEQGFSFPVYFDTEQEAGMVYGIRSIPTTLFIDKDGYIVAGVQGTIDRETLQKGIELIK